MIISLPAPTCVTRQATMILATRGLETLAVATAVAADAIKSTLREVRRLVLPAVSDRDGRALLQVELPS